MTDEEIEAAEDYEDVLAARAAREEAKAVGTVSLEEMKESLGLGSRLQ